jgi:hypothetical protein
MALITKEMLFESNVFEIIQKIETDNREAIQWSFDKCPSRYPDLLTWLEENPEIVGRAFMQHLINYGFTNEDIN